MSDADNSSPTPEMAARLKDMAVRQEVLSQEWGNSPQGLSAMGFKRVTRGPLPRNPELEAMVAAKQAGR